PPAPGPLPPPAKAPATAREVRPPASNPATTRAVAGGSFSRFSRDRPGRGRIRGGGTDLACRCRGFAVVVERVGNTPGIRLETFELMCDTRAHGGRSDGGHLRRGAARQR